MSKLIKCWEELVGLESENYKLDIDVKNCCGYIIPKVETEESEDNYCEYHKYLSSHTFYENQYRNSTMVLQRYGFDVVLDNWDK